MKPVHFDENSSFSIQLQIVETDFNMDAVYNMQFAYSVHSRREIGTSY